ncbi:hypothetical protein T4B_12996 [Trichinella pseudospiralis]|uniref:Uncharacterized protein n=1 Tax=Trichinella pseudospiralis TaxID=6337 RepID=A0A0V1J8M4_TRIPS|nr:hypothetical protein T4A_11100 [Trichinella pseudospiralis]KRZ22946.1 hypothetical protein T4B_12996 [Trichinella pseudospiralis]KRZ31261.1 hypothetical protein T4C_3974 [Trichinella pseudospiralis]
MLHTTQPEFYWRPNMYNSENHCQKHYVILRYSHAVLDCVSIKAEVWTFPDVTGPADQSGSSVWNRGTGASVDQLPLCSASFTFTLMFLSSST